MTQGNSASWIADNEKYAFVGLSVKLEGNIPTGEIAPVFRPYPPVVEKDIRLAVQLGENLGALSGTSFAGGHWRLFRTSRIPSF